MDAESENEKKRIRDAIQMIETIQSMIDVSADRLEGLRTQCSTSAELTQQEIRTLEVGCGHFLRYVLWKQDVPLNGSAGLSFKASGLKDRGE